MVKICVKENNLPELLAEDLALHFELFVQTYKEAVTQWVARKTKNSNDVEEIVQDTFLKAFLALQTYAAHDIRKMNFAAWLRAIATNLCIDWHRRSLRRPVLEFIGVQVGETLEGPGCDMQDRPEEALILSENLEEIRRYVSALPAKYQDVAKLRLFYDLSAEEIAQLTGKSVGTARNLVTKSMELLREMIRQEEKVG